MNSIVSTENQDIEIPAIVDPEIGEMMKAGIHMGHLKSKNHPSMKGNIFGVRQNVSVIDLTKTKEKLAEALLFFKSIAAKNGMILFVGTRPSARPLIEKLALEFGMPYFTGRWIGGALTNFKVISKRIEHMEKLEKESESGGFEKYTKKERLMKEREIARLRSLFGGVRTLKRLPDALFVVDTTVDEIAVHEARHTKVPVVALIDTNADASLVEYPIPANDDAYPALEYIFGKISEAIREGKASSSQQ